MKIEPVFYREYKTKNTAKKSNSVFLNTIMRSKDENEVGLNRFFAYNISFSAQNRPFYSIDKDGNYIRFNTRKEAEEQLSLAKSNIAECLQGKRITTHGYSFFYADDIERADELGNAVVDEDKLNEKKLYFQTALESKDLPTPVYAIDKDGKYTKYESKYKAAKALGINSPRIIKCLNGTLKKTGGYTFVTPEQIEQVLPNGGIIIDKKKVEEIVFKSFTESNTQAVYAIDKDGFSRKFDGIRKAARELGLEAANISRCLAGEQKRVGEYTFVRAQDIEQTDKNMRVEIDSDKIKRINNESLEHASYVPIYAIDANGNIKRFPNKKQAAAKLGIDNSALSHCLLGRYNVIKNYAFIKADDVESVDSSGKLSLNYDLIREKYEQANKNAVYVVHSDGSFKKFLTQTDAAKELGLRRTKISACINGESNSVKGDTFVKASDVETFENGKVIVNKSILQKFANELQRKGTKAVYLFDRNGNYQRFGSVKEITESLKINETGIRECLSGKRVSTCGYRFVYANNFENFDNNGNLVIDYNKIDDVSLDVCPALKKYFKKYGRIYALRGVNTEEFENIRQASRALGIDEKSIIYFLRTGRNYSDGKKSVNGYVLTCEKE